MSNKSRLLGLAFVALTPALLSSCSAFTSPPAAIAIPAVPECLTSPAAVADPVIGDDLAVIAARERAGRLDNQRKLACGADAWRQLIDLYGGQ